MAFSNTISFVEKIRLIPRI